MTLRLTYVGTDSYNRPVYEDETGRLFKCADLIKESTARLCTVCGGFDGEPDTPIEYTKYKDAEIVFIAD